MADKKISALTGATTPLAGTEVLPIVQSGATVKVSVANLTAGRAVAMAGGSFTDNITQNTAAKGVNFTANTPVASMTSQLLNWYEEGTWTPTITSSGGTITTVGTCTGQYTRIGRQVTLSMDLRITNNGTGTGYLTVAGLPISMGATLYGAGSSTEIGATGKLLALSAGTETTINITNYDGTYPGVNSFRAPVIWTYFV